MPTRDPLDAARAEGEGDARARAGRSAWLQVARGELLVNGTKLVAGDGAAIRDERALELVGVKDAEALLFDLA
jgi:redox-sensitive bicupin YhaK (pirin superfamily)